MATALQGWHPGETKLHNLLHFPLSIATRYTAIESQLREQRRIFHISNLPFIPLTVIDEYGRPWAGIAAGRSGEIGCVSSPNLKTLILGVTVWAGEPLGELLGAWKGGKEHEERSLTAGLGIEFTTRRRNKSAGVIQDVCVGKGEGTYALRVEVNEALGNCPKYISTRHLIPYPSSNPTVVHQVAHMPGNSRLPIETTAMITSADTVFIASIYRSDPATASRFPSHAGMNARSGLPGFIRVLPSDGRTVVLPDYGDVLYLTGNARNVVGDEVGTIMKRHSGCITLLEVTGYTSLYSPKVKYLVEEAEVQGTLGTSRKAALKSAQRLSSDLALFRFTVVSAMPAAAKLVIRPGQAIVLDFMDWLGPPQYRHMADTAPGSINDDGSGPGLCRVRMRAVRHPQESGTAVQIEQPVVADIVGVIGNFALGEKKMNALWVAGGIGITPFLAMLDAVGSRGETTSGDVVLALSSREPDVMLGLVRNTVTKVPKGFRIRIDLFTHAPVKADMEEFNTGNIQISLHNGRIGPPYWKAVSTDRDILICGPSGFGDAAVAGLRAVGVPNERIQRDGFY
ncbi:hypothetical protein BDW66DRAFT_151543 [Aspergillus desertorum]